MAIYGIGTDITDMPRISRALKRFGLRFAEKVLAAGEMKAMPRTEARRVEYVSARFAAKEAVVKALRTGFSSGIGPGDIEVTNDALGAPGVCLHGKALEAARRLGITKWHISISHAGDTALAFVIAEIQ